MSCKYNDIFCVLVKNKPCVKYIVVMRLIPWIHSHGSETITMRSDNGFLKLKEITIKVITFIHSVEAPPVCDNAKM